MTSHAELPARVALARATPARRHSSCVGVSPRLLTQGVRLIGLPLVCPQADCERWESWCMYARKSDARSLRPSLRWTHAAGAPAHDEITRSLSEGVLARRVCHRAEVDVRPRRTSCASAPLSPRLGATGSQGLARINSLASRPFVPSPRGRRSHSFVTASGDVSIEQVLSQVLKEPERFDPETAPPGMVSHLLLTTR